MAKRGNGEGSIVHRKDGRWMAQVTIGRDPATGKLIRRTFYGKTRQAVASKVAQAAADLKQGRPIAESKTSFGDWLMHWLDLYARRKSVGTFETYESSIKTYIVPALGHIPLRDLRPRDLQQFYSNMLAFGAVRRAGGLSPGTVHLMHVIIHAALRQAVRDDLLSRNVADAAIPPQPLRHELTPPSLAEMEQLLSVARDHRLYGLYLLYWTTGARRGELLGLRWADLDLQSGMMYLKRQLNRRSAGLKFGELKTAHSRRSVPLAAVAVEALHEHRTGQDQEKRLLGEAYIDEDLVFATPDGKPLDPANVLRGFKLLLKKAGLPPRRLHDLRHAFATLLLQRGENPKVVQALLGHSSVVTTLQIYDHLMPGLTEKAVDQLNETFTAIASKGKSETGLQ